MQSETNFQQQLAQLVQQISTAIIVLDINGRFQYLNHAAEEAFNTTSKKLTGKPYWYFIQKDSLPLRDLVKQLAETGSYLQDNFQLQLNNGKLLRADLVLQKINLGKELLLIEWQDRTNIERMTQERSRLQQQQINTVLLSNLAHEIKNPLSGIRGAAQLIEMESANKKASHKSKYNLSQIITKEVDRLTSLVNRMLLGQQSATKLSINIHEILEQLTSFVNLTLPTSIKIIRDYDPSLPNFMLAPELIYQAVLNLIKNSVEACHSIPKATITLKTRAQLNKIINGKQFPLSLSIEVIDTGVGIPKELQHTLFFPLISGKKSSGLGLGISQTIIQQHNGLIEFDSQAHLTCFRVIIPFEQKANETKPLLKSKRDT